MSKVDYDKAVELYQQGRTAKQVGEALGVHPETVRKILKMRQIPRRQTGWRKGKAKSLDIDRDTLSRMYWDENQSASAIANHFGVSTSTIHNYLKRLDIPLRAAGGQLGELNASWSGGRTIDKDGYILVRAKAHPRSNRAGYVREHRLVMEKKLGRFLTATEVVHHIDGNPQNNDPDNLYLYDCNADHLRDELTGRTPNWSEEGLHSIRHAQRIVPEWNDERRRRQSEAMKASWANGERSRAPSESTRKKLSESAKRRQIPRDRHGRFAAKQ